MIYIDAVQRGDDIVLWTRENKDTIQYHEIPLSEFLYCYTISNDPSVCDARDIYGSPLRKVKFKDKWEMKEYRNSHDGLCESDVQPAYKALLDLFSDVDMDLSLVNTWYYDIEVDFDLSEGRGYPTPDNPYGAVNSFQFYDTYTKEYYIIHTSHDGSRPKPPIDADNKVNMILVNTEMQLLLTVSEYMDSLGVDLLTGWNSGGFDLPYIMERAIQKFGESKARTMFCRGGVQAKFREYVNDFGQDAIHWTLVGRQHVDMLELYKKFIPSQKKSFSLSSVCLEDLGVDKIDYDGDLGELYRTNQDLFFEYALQDVRLLKMLDDKHKIMTLAKSIAFGSCIKIGDVTGSVKVIEHDLMKFCHKRGKVLPDRSNNEKTKYDGAIVYDCVSGMHEWIFSLDLVSLYPKTMILLGLSRETLIYQCLGGYEDWVHIITKNDTVGSISVECDRTGEIYQMLPSALEKTIRDNGWTISANGTIFDGSLGILAEYVSEGFAQRVEYKKKMKECFAAGDVVGGEMYDLYQKVIKVARLNAVYGASGNESFRLFDLRLAKSITLTAQMISKQQCKAGNEAVNAIEKELLGG